MARPPRECCAPPASKFSSRPITVSLSKTWEDLESSRPIDLLITDIVMPDRVNAVALSRMPRMRRPELKVIYLTVPGVEDEAIGPVLRKPIDDEQLVAEVRRILAAG